MKQNRPLWTFQDSWLLLAIVAVGAALGLLCLQSLQIGQPADDANYLILAESLAAGHGLRLICFPSAPLEQWFPAGWPLLLTPILLISPKNYELTRILPFAFTLVSIVAVYMIGRRYWRREIGLASTLLFAVAPAIVLGTGSPMSEPAYTAFSLLAMVCVERLLAEEHPTWRTVFAASLLIAATIAVRTIGFTLLAAAVTYLLLHSKMKLALGLLLIPLALLVPQFILNASAGGAILSPSYQMAVSGGLIEKLNHILQNLIVYLTDIMPSLLVGAFGPQVDHLLRTYGLGWAGITLKAAAIGAVGIGFAWSFRTLRLYHVYVALFFAATLLYYNPVSGSALPRYLAPILPFLIAFLLMGVMTIVSGVARSIRIQKTSDDVGRAALIALIATVSLIFVISVGRVIQQGMVSPLRDRMTDVSAGASWIGAHTSQTAIVAMPNPVPRYIYAQRKVLWFPAINTPEDLLDWFKSNGVTHLLVGPPLRPNLDTTLDDYQTKYVIPLIRSYPEQFRLEYTDDRWNVKVYSIR